MTRRISSDLQLGAGVVEMLIPHRRPFLLVDGVSQFRRGSKPGLTAYRHVSLNDPVFEGHFPGLPLWPGALTMEGLGQTCALLLSLRTICRRAEQNGDDAEAALEFLRNVDRGIRMHPGYRPTEMPRALEDLGDSSGKIGVGAAVQMKFLEPVLPGCRIDYFVELDADLGDRIRFTTEARVEETTVAKGTITGAVVSRPFPGRNARGGS